MAILTADDKDVYMPGLALEDEALLSAIAQAQLFAEGPQGADRPLEIRQYTETLYLTQSGIAQLQYLPIDDSQAIVVKARGGEYEQYWVDALRPENRWRDVASTEYTLDVDTGELQFETLGINNSRFYRGSSRRASKPLGKLEAPQIKVTYYSGFDFAADSLSSEVEQLKRALAGLVMFRENAKGAFSGQTAFTLDNFYSVQFGDTSKVATSSMAVSPFDEFLLVFRKYRPRTLPF